MYWIVGLITLSLVSIMAMGVYYEWQPPAAGGPVRRRFKRVVGVNVLTFLVAEVGLLLLGVQNALAQQVNSPGPKEVTVGLGLALIGIGIPTGLATIGAGIAVGPVGAASLAVIAEKPEIFGRTLIYLGLAEGIAIYGLVVTILLLGRI